MLDDELTAYVGDSAPMLIALGAMLIGGIVDLLHGPLTILGSLNDGLGNGADQLFLKSALDGFAAIAFAAAFGWGVAASVVTLVVVQGSLTVLGVALRLLKLREVAVADLLPALLVAPLLVEVVGVIR